MRAFWRLERSAESVVLIVEPLEPLADSDRAAIMAEGVRLLVFVASESGGRSVRFLPVVGDGSETSDGQAPSSLRRAARASR